MAETFSLKAETEGHFLSMSQVAKRLGVSRWSVAQAISRGELSGVRVGRTARISRESFADFLQKNALGKVSQNSAQNSCSERETRESDANVCI